MNIDVPNLLKAVAPESEGRNVRIVSNNGPNHRDAGFLSSDFPHSKPKLYLIAEMDDFDEVTLDEWRNEGFDVDYFAMDGSPDENTRKLRDLSKQHTGPCETFGIVAYGDAAASCLQHYHVMDNNPGFKLGLLIAYYPTAIPDPKGKFPNEIRVLVHLATGEDIGVVKQSQMVGIQGKKRMTRKKVESGLGAGGTLQLAYPGYSYNAEPGFAEHDMEEYDRISADLAWSRSLTAARAAFALENNWENTLEQNEQGKFFGRNLKQVMSTYTSHKEPHVTFIPTLTGATGAANLRKFYSEVFAVPPSLKLTLLSRTMGADRVVDEMHVKFKHTQEVPWILPGVPATNKNVEIVMVSIVTLRGGKLYHEHVYWDQASVLVQTGLLDRKLVSQEAKKLGVEKLPVVGRTAAKRILGRRDAEDEGEADNKLVPGWDKSPAGQDKD